MRGLLTELETMGEDTRFDRLSGGAQGVSTRSPAVAAQGLHGRRLACPIARAAADSFRRNSLKKLVFYLTRAGFSDNRHPLPKHFDSRRAVELAVRKPH